ncbi:MAG: hypothetical protein VX529_11050 [Pseudomonadota bacterium]|nr:hypothetical protein [Pseudomonadota bacterium]
MTALLSTLWGKIMTGVAGALLALAVCFCVLWFFADRAREREREARLAAEDAQITAEAETKRTQQALTAAEARASARAAQNTRQREDEEAIRDEPETFNCAASPAVSRALGILQQRRAGDTAPAGDPAQPSDVLGLPAAAGPDRE